MSATIRQLVNRRKIHRISRSAVAEHMGCTIAWLRFLEAGGPEGRTLSEWRDRYESALNAIVSKRKAAK